MKQLHILMIAPTPYFSDRGCHVRIFEEARALIELGHKVQICTYHLGRDLGEVPTRRIPSVPWYRKQTAGPSWHKPYLDGMLFFSALLAARKFKPNLIHAHLHEGAFIGFFLKKILHVPMVFDCQGSLCGELVDHNFIQEKSIMYWFFKTLEQWINNRADHVIASATPTAELLHTKFGVPIWNVTAVIDGVNTEEFRPKCGNAQLLRQQLRLPMNKKLVVFLGAMNEYQGVDLLLEAICRLTHRADEMHFLLMGFPEERYVAKAQSLGLLHMVTFTGRIDYRRAPEYLGLGDIAVSPKLSQTEANGKLFNYMACGLPTVVFEAPVNREILGDFGTYADFGDAESLAVQIEELLQNGKMLAELAQQVREKAVADYSWREAARKITEVYGKIWPVAKAREVH